MVARNERVSEVLRLNGDDQTRLRINGEDINVTDEFTVRPCHADSVEFVDTAVRVAAELGIAAADISNWAIHPRIVTDEPIGAAGVRDWGTEIITYDDSR
jgi:hypothetical protein